MLRLILLQYKTLFQKYFLFRYRNILEVKGKNLIEKCVYINPLRRNNGHKLKIYLTGNNTIKHHVIIQGSGTLTIGENSFIGSYSVIGCNELITIGKNCMIAQSVSIRDTDHDFSNINIPMMEQGIITKPICIKDNVWIGYGAVITKGITLGEGSIIGANAVVTKDVEPFSIVAGVPAKIIKKRV